MRKHNDTYCGGDDLDKAAERMIQQDVLACQTGLVEDCLKSNLMEWENVENLYEQVCPECGEEPTKHDGGTELEDAWSCECGWHSGEGGEPDSNPREVLEWWLVSSFLAPHLTSMGEVTLTDGQSNWWGRCCSGQSMVLDGLFQALCAERDVRIAQPSETGGRA